MTFKELDIGDYFIQWDTIDECYYMYCKWFEDKGVYVDNKLRETDWGVIPFHSHDIVYKVIV